MNANDTEHTLAGQSTGDASSDTERVFLVIVDDSEELERALYYASRRAKRLSARVALLYCDPLPESQHFMQFMGIGRRLEEESRETAEALLSDLSEKAHRWSGKIPMVWIEQDIQVALPKILEEEKISIIIQPMPSAESSSGSWAHYLLQGGADKMHIPVTMIPPTMTIDEINRIT